MSEEKKEVNLNKVLLHLERIFNNLNQYWHSIELLLGHVSKPLLINDMGLQKVLTDFKSAITKMTEDMKSMDIAQAMAEIKYIGKRLNEIEIILKEMEKEGVKKHIHLDVTMDGYEMIKKNSYNEAAPKEDPEIHVIALLDTLTEREKECVKHRIGLLGERKKTYVSIGKILKISGSRCCGIYRKAMRKLRHPSRRDLVKLVTHTELLQEIGIITTTACLPAPILQSVYF